jgi:hypothetical protein
MGEMPSIPVVSLPAQQAGAAAQRPRLRGGHAGTAASQDHHNHDHERGPFPCFISPAGTRAGGALLNCLRTTSITGVANFSGLS